MTLQMMSYKVVQDDSPESPREFEPLSTLCLFHSRYNLANESGLRQSDYDSWDEVKREIEAMGGINVTPVWMYDHGNVTLQVGESNPFTCPWDSGMVGFAYTTAGRVEALGTPEDRVADVIAGEVDEYSQYLSGDVWGYEIVDEDTGEIIDSVWGFYGYETAEAEATSALQPVA